MLGAVGDGTVEWNCNGVDRPMLLKDVASNGVTSAPDISDIAYDDFGYEDAYTAQAIGPDWIQVLVRSLDGDDVAYWDRTARTFAPELKAPDEYPNLDTPGLAQRLCKPLSRTRMPGDHADDIEPLYEPYFYERPYGVGIEDSIDKNSAPVSERITLQRCGSATKTVVARCNPTCFSVGYSAGVVTWVDDRALRAYVPSTHKHFSWRLTGFRPGLSNAGLFQTSVATLVHTRERLIASIPPIPGGHEWQIWAARLPQVKSAK
jgi:hypothetical protein